MQKYFFQVVQQDLINRDIYSKIHFAFIPRLPVAMSFSQAFYGVEALKKTGIWDNVVMDDLFGHPSIEEAVYAISDAVAKIPHRSYLECAAKVYNQVHGTENLLFGIVRMRDAKFFAEFDSFLERKKWKLPEEKMKIINVLVQDGTARFDAKCDYAITTSHIGKQFSDIITEVTGYGKYAS